ncbi:MAG: N-acetylmuramoyl-L-alanine amidase family protein [Bacillota bacterium]|jgi:N-acetylmuramoyl-L-alanine amidase
MLKTKNDHPWWSGAAGRRQRLGRKRWLRLALLGIVAGVGCYLLAALAVQVWAPAWLFRGTIVLDPGHGGAGSPGCVYAGIVERDVALELSLLLRDELAQRGYRVIMTRDTDQAVSLEERAALANKGGADLFISIHLNAHDVASVNGIETWFNPHTNSESSALAEHVQRSLVAATGAKDRGTYPSTSLYLTREVRLPACLVEAGYLSNEAEREKLNSEAYRQQVARGIADGVDAYLAEPR